MALKPMTGTDDIVYLEGYIDHYGLSNVLFALHDICQEKAEHIRTNWQDEHTARQWDKVATRLHREALKRNP